MWRKFDKYEKIYIIHFYFVHSLTIYTEKKKKNSIIEMHGFQKKLNLLYFPLFGTHRWKLFKQYVKFIDWFRENLKLFQIF